LLGERNIFLGEKCFLSIQILWRYRDKMDGEHSPSMQMVLEGWK
jgi:hypothetical protein